MSFKGSFAPALTTFVHSIATEAQKRQSPRATIVICLCHHLFFLFQAPHKSPDPVNSHPGRGVSRE